MYFSYLYYFANCLGVTITEEDLNIPPQIFKTDFPKSPLCNLDWGKVYEYIREFEEQGVFQNRVCYVIQGGSNSAKRFATATLINIKTTLETLFPRTKFYILSTIPIDNKDSDFLLRSGCDGIIDATLDINKTIAYFIAPKEGITVITTDTFMAWLSAGALSLRSSDRLLTPNTLYILYTLANPEFWHINGANAVESPIIEYFRGQGRFSHGGDSVLTPDQYYRYHQIDPIKGAVSIADISILLRYIVSQNIDNSIS